MYTQAEINRFDAARLDREIVKTQKIVETYDAMSARAAARGDMAAHVTYTDKCDLALAYLARLGHAGL